MSENVADFLLGRLREWGIRRIYGFPGDGINAILGAFGRADNDPELIQVRHEEMAAFMACAHAKFTGEVGVCMATSGPGAIHLLNGLYDAKLDHQPVVAIVGQQALSSLGGSFQQEVDLTTLFKDVAHEYVEMASEPSQVRHLVDRAHSDRQGSAHGHLRDHPERCRVDGRRPGSCACARHDSFLVGVLASSSGSLGSRSSSRRGDPERRRQSGDAGRRWRARCQPTR